VAAASGACRAAEPGYDNLVLVTIDTQRADRLGLYGYPRPTSPLLDRLGREGIVFWHAVAASSHTGPSHASILTSLYPEQHQLLVNGQELPAAVPTLAELARQGGFETAAFVSVRFLSGLGRGFETFDADVPERQVFRVAGDTVDRAVSWLRARDRGRRFVLWVHVYDPHEHSPGTALPEPHYARMEADGARRGKELLYFLRQEQGYPKDEVDGNIHRYDAQVAYVDEQLARLFAVLDEAAPPERTLRVVTADHGEGLGNHGVEGHGRHLYQEQVRVPLIVHGDPRRHPPTTVRGLVRHVDLVPTVAELLGLPLDRPKLRLEGRSLVPVLTNPSADVGIDAAFAQRRPPDERRREAGWEAGTMISAQDARFKYIWSSEGPHEFYDIQRDPYELDNLIDAPVPQKERLRDWLLAKYRALCRDRRAAPAGEIDPRVLEDLKALGYL
jgi:arylsulfatase A-like enzyme